MALLDPQDRMEHYTLLIHAISKNAQVRLGGKFSYNRSPLGKPLVG